MEYEKLKNLLIKNMNINEKSMHFLSMGEYVKRITVKEFFEVLENAFETVKKETNSCGCLKCFPNEFPNIRFNVCPICGNKRCPHASDHNYECTNSNEPGQIGSVYE